VKTFRDFPETVKNFQARRIFLHCVQKNFPPCTIKLPIVATFKGSGLPQVTPRQK